MENKKYAVGIGSTIRYSYAKDSRKIDELAGAIGRYHYSTNRLFRNYTLHKKLSIGRSLCKLFYKKNV